MSYSPEYADLFNSAYEEITDKGIDKVAFFRIFGVAETERKALRKEMKRGGLHGETTDSVLKSRSLTNKLKDKLLGHSPKSAVIDHLRKSKRRGGSPLVTAAAGGILGALGAHGYHRHKEYTRQKQERPTYG